MADGEGAYKKYFPAFDRTHYLDNKDYDGCIFCDTFDVLSKEGSVPCSVILNESRYVPVIKRYEHNYLAVNYRPYVPRGHVMIISNKHRVYPYELTDQEIIETKTILMDVMKAETAEYGAVGFNIGYNIGKRAGGTVEHLHMHVIPRFESESGFMEAVAGVRIVQESSEETMHRLAKRLKSL